MAIAPLQLLEINVISAQDLAPVSKKMQTYATAWVHPTRKLSTRVDSDGNNNPTWNDKFVFRVDEDFLRSDTSAVMIEIYGVHWLRDKHVGSVRILVGNLIPPVRNNRRQHHLGMRFVALQVRRRSGRPQGILNIGVTLLDSSMRSMPLYTHLCASAVGFHDLMNDDDLRRHYHNNNNNNNKNNNNNDNNDENKTPPPFVKPILLRSRSERSERVKFDDDVSYNGSSVVGVPQGIGYGRSGSVIGSVISGSDFMDPPKGKGKKGKASSVISGAELREKKKGKGKKSRASSVVNGAELKTPPKDPNSPIKDPQTIDPPKDKLDTDPQPKKPITAPRPIPKQNAYDYWPNNGKFMYGGPKKANSIWSDSEVGPSPSEVAAAMAEQRYPLDDGSLLDGWSLDESVEGLRSKLDRWRTEVPPLYDQSMSMSSFPTTSQHTRRHTDGGGSSGLFSCFGNFMGYECQCICGKPPKTRRRSYGGHYQSPSATVPRAFM